MARIAGIDLPREKRIEIALQYIYGIGKKSAKDVLAKASVSTDIRTKDLTEAAKSSVNLNKLLTRGSAVVTRDGCCYPGSPTQRRTRTCVKFCSG